MNWTVAVKVVVIMMVVKIALPTVPPISPVAVP
jgi:hypothetical protein